MISCLQHTLILPDSDKSVNASCSSDSHLILSYRIPPGGSSHTDTDDSDNFLKFVVDKPSSEVLSQEDFDPIKSTCQLSYRAVQMGGSASSFMIREYSNFHSSNTEPCVTVQYPVQNTSGIVGLKTMRGGETTRIIFDLTNISTKPIGSGDIDTGGIHSSFKQKDRRRLFVCFRLLSDSMKHYVDSDAIVFRDSQMNNKECSLQGLSYAIPNVVTGGHIFEVPLISGSMSSLSLNYSLELRNKKIKGFERAKIQAEIYLQDIEPLKNGESPISFSLIQRRQHVISCQPGFKDLGDAAQIVLVTNSSTTRGQFMEWSKILGPECMGMTMDVLSLDLYGSLDPKSMIRANGKARSLSDALKGKLVILLNEPFYPWTGSTDQRNIECRPAAMLSSHISMFQKSTHWLVVGGCSDDLPDFDCTSAIRTHSFVRNSTMERTETKDKSCDTFKFDCRVPGKSKCKTNCSFSNCKSFRRFINKAVRLEQRNGNPNNSVGSRISPEKKEKRNSTVSLDDPNCSVITVKSNCLFQPNKEKAEKILLKRAKKLKKFLQSHDTLRRYIIDVVPNTTKRLRVENALWWKRDVGELHIHRGVSRRDDEILYALQHCVQQQDHRNNPDDDASSPSICVQRDGSGRKSLTHSLATLQGIASALPLNCRLDSYCFAITHLSVASSSSSNLSLSDQLVGVMNNALTKSVLNDMVIFYDGRFKENKYAGESHLQFRSPTLFQLEKHVGLNQLVSSMGSKPSPQKAVISRILSLLIGHLRCVVSSKDMAPWWSPFSRKHSVRRVFSSDLHKLEQHWAAILNDELVRETQSIVIEQVKTHIKIDRNKFFLRCRQRWRAGLSYVHSPECTVVIATKKEKSSKSNPSKTTSRTSSISSPEVKMFGQESLASIGTRASTTRNVFHQYKTRKCTPVIFDTESSNRIHTAIFERSRNANSIYHHFQDDRSNLILSNDSKQRTSPMKNEKRKNHNNGSSRQNGKRPTSKKKAKKEP